MTAIRALHPINRRVLPHQVFHRSRFRASTEETPKLPAVVPSLRVERTATRKVTEEIRRASEITAAASPGSELPVPLTQSHEVVVSRTTEEKLEEKVTVTGDVTALIRPAPTYSSPSRVNHANDEFVRTFIAEALKAETGHWARHYAEQLQAHGLNPYKLLWLELEVTGRSPRDPIFCMKKFLEYKRKIKVRMSNQHDPIDSQDLLQAFRASHTWLQEHSRKNRKPNRRDYLNMVSWEVGYAQAASLDAFLAALNGLYESEREEFFRAYNSYRPSIV